MGGGVQGGPAQGYTGTRALQAEEVAMLSGIFRDCLNALEVCVYTPDGRTRMYVRMRAYIHAYIHICIHTYNSINRAIVSIPLDLDLDLVIHACMRDYTDVHVCLYVCVSV